MAKGRPVEYTEERIKEINDKLNKYIDETDIPIVVEFAYKNDIRRATLYEISDLAYTIKRLIDKKEANLERMGLQGRINITMAVFSLKQLGWKDKTEVDHNVKADKTILEIIAGQLNKNNEVQGNDSETGDGS
jgi:hypothetical protein